MKAPTGPVRPGSRGATACRLVVAVLLASCSHQAPVPGPAPLPGEGRVGGGIALRQGWHALVLVQRNDSIVLTLPSGDKQVQRFDRRAGFTLSIDGDGQVSLRLDSLGFRPKPAKPSDVPVGTTWTGRAGDIRVNAMRASSGGDPAAELTAMVRNLLPRLPAGGVRARMTWVDSATGDVRVDVFKASEHRMASWSTGTMSDRSGVQILPVLLKEDFEQLGDGSQGGHRLTMTSQGRRIGTYYLTSEGKLSGAQLDDSVAMLISIPDSRQVVPTIRYARTLVRYIPAVRNEAEQSR